MSYRQEFRPDLNLVYIRFGTHLGLDALREVALGTYRHPSYLPGMCELWDLRAVETIDPRINFDRIHEIWQAQATWIRTWRQRTDVVMVAHGDLVFGLLRIYASLAETERLHCTPCRDWGNACRLLGLDPRTEFLSHRAGA